MENIREVVKRNGSIVPFDIEKVYNVIDAAFRSVNEPYKVIAQNAALKGVVDNTLDILYSKATDNIVDVENIQDAIEDCLLCCGHYKAGKKFVLYREEHKQARFIRERIDYMDKYSQSHDNAATSSETDANANVTMKNVANLEGEVYKTTNRVIQRQRMKDKLNELFPEVAKKYEEDLNHHIIYTHDEATTPVLKQYCMAVSLYPLMMEGVGNIDGVTPSAPNDLQSFSGQITNLIFLLSSQCKGAVAVGEYFIALNYYIVKEFGEDWYNRLDEITTSSACNKQRTIRDTIHKAFKQFVYGVNQPAGNRSYQSPLRNLVLSNKFCIFAA